MRLHAVYGRKSLKCGIQLNLLPTFCDVLVAFMPHALSLQTCRCTQLTNTKHICVSGGKMTQDVGMVWKCCGVIPI